MTKLEELKATLDAAEAAYVYAAARDAAAYAAAYAARDARDAARDDAYAAYAADAAYRAELKKENN